METVDFFQNTKTPATVIHVLSVTLGMGTALLSDFLFSFFSKDKELDQKEIATLSILSKIIFISLIVISVSGLFIFLSDPNKYMTSSKFLAKMTILVVLMINGYILNKNVWPKLLNKEFFTSDKERIYRKIAFACGAVSVVSWISVCILGVIDSLSMEYYDILLTYISIIVFSILVSLFVEKRILN